MAPTAAAGAGHRVSQLREIESVAERLTQRAATHGMKSARPGSNVIRPVKNRAESAMVPSVATVVISMSSRRLAG